MQEISAAVQEGAAAYLRRQFRTLAVFVVIIFFVLLLLPADGDGVRWGRSVFFLVGALFSALTGFTGMSLAMRGNVRVAAAAKESGEHSAMRIAFRTGGVAGHVHRRPRPVRRGGRGVHLQGATRRACSRASASARRCSPCSCGSAAASSPRPPTSARTWSARSRRASPRTTRGTRPRSPTTSATTSGDCAGMAADLFESYSVMLVAALILGKVAFGNYGPGLPADRPDDRRDHRGRRHLRGRAAQVRPQRHDRDQPRLLHLGGVLR